MAQLKGNSRAKKMRQKKSNNESEFVNANDLNKQLNKAIFQHNKTIKKRIKAMKKNLDREIEQTTQGKPPPTKPQLKLP